MTKSLQDLASPESIYYVDNPVVKMQLVLLNFRYLYSTIQTPNAMSRPVIFLLSALSLFTSCRPEKKTDLFTIDILEGLKTEKEFRLSEIVEGVDYVKLETTSACLFSYAQIMVGKKHILVVQSYNPTQIFLFNRDGSFVRKIGAEGKGPQEYTSISNVAADPEESYILVNDYQKNLILKYSYEGVVNGSFNYKEILGGNARDIVFNGPNEIYLRMDYPLQGKRNFYLIRKIDSTFHQLDSLYPVSTHEFAGNGFSWGSGDFYLRNGSIQFRQFSFDTLYGESNGQMEPRFCFPIGADHLPGPYLISGLHKQMMEYTNYGVVAELSDYLIITTSIAPRKGGLMIFNKLTGDIFRLKKYAPCPPDTIGRRLFINDIDGIINQGYFKGENGLFVETLQLIDLKEQLGKNCPETKNVRFPDKRQELIDLANSSKEDDNPILRIFHLK
jgi:hypothetical protein